MFGQLFGNYLVEKEIIKEDAYRRAVRKQLSTRAKLGTIAIAEGLLSEEEVDIINKMQMQFDKRFGDIAMERGLLTLQQISDLLDKQGNPYMQFVEALIECTGLTTTVIEKTLAAFQKEKGFVDEEMAALKNDNLEVLVPIFAFSNKPHVTELAELVLKNINRFITRDFYFDKIKHVKELDYYYLAGQRTDGKDSYYLALAETERNDTFVKVASNFANAEDMVSEDEIFDAVCEFINVNSGLYAAELGMKDIDVDMEPVFAYKDQKIKGDFYILPIHLEGKRIHLVISVNDDTIMGETPYEYETNDEISYDVRENAKGTVLLVDDSGMSRNMLKNILEEADYSIVAEARDGFEAIAAYKKYKPNLVTMDITMPNMDGIEALQGILAYDPYAKVVMISAAGQQNKLIQALKCGAKKFVTKPFDKDEVINNIDEVLSKL